MPVRREVLEGLMHLHSGKASKASITRVGLATCCINIEVPEGLLHRNEDALIALLALLALLALRALLALLGTCCMAVRCSKACCTAVNASARVSCVSICTSVLVKQVN